MGELKLKRYELPENIHQFTKKEEAQLFPKPGTQCLAYIDGDLTLLTFGWYYGSSKMGPDGEFIRDGKGETYWTTLNGEEDFIVSNESRPFTEYWAVIEKDTHMIYTVIKENGEFDHTDPARSTTDINIARRWLNNNIRVMKVRIDSGIPAGELTKNEFIH